MARERKDSILPWLGIHPYRCYICKHRFYLFQPPVLRHLAGPITAPAANLGAPAAKLTPAAKLKPEPIKSPIRPWDTDVIT
jgi:hypothetical protein